MQLRPSRHVLRGLPNSGVQDFRSFRPWVGRAIWLGRPHGRQTRRNCTTPLFSSRPRSEAPRTVSRGVERSITRRGRITASSAPIAQLPLPGRCYVNHLYRCPGTAPPAGTAISLPPGRPDPPARFGAARSASDGRACPLHEWIELVRTADGDHATEHAEVEPPDARGWLLPPPHRPEPRPAPPRLLLGLGPA